MEEMYGGFHPTADDDEYSDKALMSPDHHQHDLILPCDYHSFVMNSGGGVSFRDNSTLRMPDVFGGCAAAPATATTDELIFAASAISEAASVTPDFQRARGDYDTCSTAIKAKIASHPHYPRLLQAYINCHKVGAPPEIVKILEEIRRESDICRQDLGDTTTTTCLGADPELDEFMETYCEILDKYKLDLSRPFDEATNFLSNTQTQLRNLCKGAFVTSVSEEGAASSDEDHYSGGEIDVQDLQARDEDRDLKDQLLRRFGSHISSLKLEFSKKKKKGKLPREARQTLFEWWNAHYKWPYPTEADKIALAETTGLDQRQINNWFINQRKRHWKPSENMQYALMDNISGQYFTDD